jgi:nitrate reductase gamma subunit
MFNMFIFVVFPYMCLSVMVFGAVAGLVSAGLGISAPATGFFENRKLFWGSVPWHYGILTVLLGHLAGLIFPGLVLEASSSKAVLTGFEVLALSGGFAALFGALVLLFRRLSDERLTAVSRPADYVALVLLILQVTLGISVAVAHRWGISWYASNMSGYLWGIFTFRPSLVYVSGIPAVLAAHMVFGFLLLAVLPFTRLMHALYVPVLYLFRKPQIMRGYEKEGHSAG